MSACSLIPLLENETPEVEDFGKHDCSKKCSHDKQLLLALSASNSPKSFTHIISLTLYQTYNFSHEIPDTHRDAIMVQAFRDQDKPSESLSYNAFPSLWILRMCSNNVCGEIRVKEGQGRLRRADILHL